VFLLPCFLVLTLNTVTLPTLEPASRARTGTTTEGGIQPLPRFLCGQVDPDYKALFDKVVKAKADLPGPKARDYTRKVKVTFTVTVHLTKLRTENPPSVDEVKETHRADGAAYWEWLKDQPVSREVVGEGGDVTRVRHLFPVTKHGRSQGARAEHPQGNSGRLAEEVHAAGEPRQRQPIPSRRPLAARQPPRTRRPTASSGGGSRASRVSSSGKAYSTGRRSRTSRKPTVDWTGATRTVVTTAS
jgi:hypothetical protein